jgi:hypothetical protein
VRRVVIRSTIYALGRRGADGDTGLRTRLVAETGRASAVLGFSPALRMTGLLDTLVADNIADHLLAVLREALTNTARHAHATAVDIAAEATATRLTLLVTDNGRGIDPTRTRSSGLATLHTRATELGGTLTLTPHRHHPGVDRPPSRRHRLNLPRQTPALRGPFGPSGRRMWRRMLDTRRARAPRPAQVTARLSRRPEHPDNVPVPRDAHATTPSPGPRATTTRSST